MVAKSSRNLRLWNCSRLEGVSTCQTMSPQFGFAAIPGRLHLHRPRACSRREIDLILQFCESIGLDYGELDVLRNRSDSASASSMRNKTPHGSCGNDCGNCRAALGKPKTLLRSAARRTVEADLEHWEPSSGISRVTMRKLLQSAST
jgi:hypothetical protein